MPAAVTGFNSEWCKLEVNLIHLCNPAQQTFQMIDSLYKRKLIVSGSVCTGGITPFQCPLA